MFQIRYFHQSITKNVIRKLSEINHLNEMKLPNKIYDFDPIMKYNFY